MWDAIFCSGLLYHLDHPAHFLHVLGRLTRRVLILQTHYALKDSIPPDFSHRLSELTTHEGNEGRWYLEFADGSPHEEMETALWASYGNRKSFWIERMHLLNTLREAGFPMVFEQFDYLWGGRDDYIARTNRGLFVAIR
jgi:hypothetical protein